MEGELTSLSLKAKLERRETELASVRSGWVDPWKRAIEHFAPVLGRFDDEITTSPASRYEKLYDSTGLRATRTMAAGMLAGMTSPARPWFRVTVEDEALSKRPAVLRWLDDVTRIMRSVYNGSNTYRSLHRMYTELGVIGTAAEIQLYDGESVVHSHTLTAGEYMIAEDERGRVNTLIRTSMMRVVDIVRSWPLDRISNHVKSLYRNGLLDKRIKVFHVIEPREDRRYGSPLSIDMPWRSVYFEHGGEGDMLLSEGGFNDFRVLAPRWARVGNSPYGVPPAFEALGDVMQLQAQQLRKGQAIDYMVRPPLQAPYAMRNQGIRIEPGQVNYVDVVGPQNAVRTLFDVNLDLGALREDIMDVRDRINSTFYADLFLMMINDPRASPATAREVVERHEEKMVMLGPVIESLHDELLKPKIDLTFADCLRAGLIPPPPPEMQGVDLKVRFVSVLAQAQQLVGVNAVDRFVGTLGQLAPVKPDVMDKLDADKMADMYADMLGVDPDLVVANDDVVLIRQQRAQQQAAMEQAALAEQGANAARNLSQADTEGRNALTDMLQGYTG